MEAEVGVPPEGLGAAEPVLPDTPAPETALFRACRRARRLRGAGMELAADFFSDLVDDGGDVEGLFDAVLQEI